MKKKSKSSSFSFVEWMKNFILKLMIEIEINKDISFCILALLFILFFFLFVESSISIVLFFVTLFFCMICLLMPFKDKTDYLLFKTVGKKKIIYFHLNTKLPSEYHYKHNPTDKFNEDFFEKLKDYKNFLIPGVTYVTITHALIIKSMKAQGFNVKTKKAYKSTLNHIQKKLKKKPDGKICQFYLVTFQIGNSH